MGQSFTGWHYPSLSLCMQRRIKELVENARSEGLDSVPVSHREGLACVHWVVARAAHEKPHRESFVNTCSS